ncbi:MULTISPECIES: DUF6114 domain-containing protein [unclassified Streptomyces]|uniref:DUF6114 domain-containing protein n=1 Tax=unclassified Streptomyces TaxID=2593676 RepID=UPI0005A951BF|nr:MULTISPECIES: DUF6114 domain-containing protein [unclassified Streptomyces]ODA72971.1 hypothetical protein APS67_002939 [Streptomyces sp. AVP053U2]
MSAETPVQSAGTFTRLRLRFRDWRGTRPFWAGLFTLLGGVPIAYFPYTTLKLGHMSLAMATTAGAGSLIIGLLLITLGLTMWFQQATRIFAGVASILLALVSLVVSNMGGFVLGFLLALVGGALALSWVPDKPQAEAGGRWRFPGGPSRNGAQKDTSESAPEGTGTGQPHPPHGAGGSGEADGARIEDHDRGHRVG